jgi:hypothetical protein
VRKPPCQAVTAQQGLWVCTVRRGDLVVRAPGQTHLRIPQGVSAPSSSTLLRNGHGEVSLPIGIDETVDALSEVSLDGIEYALSPLHQIMRTEPRSRRKVIYGVVTDGVVVLAVVVLMDPRYGLW